MALVDLPQSPSGAAASVFGTDYRELISSAGSTNSNTSVSISTSGAANYIVDPYNTSSTLTGTPSSSTPSGYGWRTPGAQGQVIPAGTWTFAAETNTSGVTLGIGTAFVRVYAYSTDTLGGNVQPIGTVTGGTDLLTTLGGTQSHTLSFSAPELDLRDRVLVVEYWIIVTQAPLLGATVTLRTVGSVTSVELPTSPVTTYYLATPQLHSMGLDDSVAAADGTSQFYDSSRLLSDDVMATDSVNFHITRSVSDGVTISEQTTPRISRLPADAVAISDALEIDIIRSQSESTAITDAISRTYSADRSASDSVAFADMVVTHVTRSVLETLAVADNAAAKITTRSVSESLSVSDTTSISVLRPISETLAISDSITKSVTKEVSDSTTITESMNKSVTYAISDTLSVSDSESANITGRASTDFIVLSDSISTSISRSISESVSASDRVDRKYSSSGPVSDAIAMADLITISVPGSASESVSVVDDILIGVTKTMVDDLAISDGISRGASLNRSLTESVALAEGVIANRALFAAISDGFATSDAIETASTGNAFARTTSDSLNLTEAISVTYGPEVLLADGVIITDNITVLPQQSKGMAESIAIVDAVDSTASITREISDSVSISAGTGDIFQAALADSLAVVDSVDAVVHGFTANVNEAVSVDAQLTVSVNRSLDIGDTVALIDTVSGPFIQERSVMDNLTISDQVRSSAHLVNIAETLSASDQTDAAIFTSSSSGNENVRRGGGAPVDVTTYPESYFRANPLAKVKLLEVAFTNAQDTDISEAILREPVTIDITFKNYQRSVQDCVLIVQIVDANGFTSNIEWTTETLAGGQTIQTSRSWTSTEPSLYEVQILIWDSSGAPMPLSEVTVSFLEVV